MMNSDDGAWFFKQYGLTSFDVKEDIRSFDDGPYTYKITGDRPTATFTMPKQLFELLVMHSKIGLEELERARERSNNPNVQAAYDAYITMLALSKQYD